MSRVLHHLLILLIASALLLAPVAGAGMLHGESAAVGAVQMHCPELPGAGQALKDAPEQAGCEGSCMACPACGAVTLPLAVVETTWSVAAEPAAILTLMEPGAGGAPDLPPPS